MTSPFFWTSHYFKQIFASLPLCPFLGSPSILNKGRGNPSSLSTKTINKKTIPYFLQESQNFGIVQVQILLTACWKFVIERASSYGSGWKYYLTYFHWPTISQKQIINTIMIIKLIIYRVNKN